MERSAVLLSKAHPSPIIEVCCIGSWKRIINDHEVSLQSNKVVVREGVVP